MDQLQLKIHMGQFRYGAIYMIILDLIHQYNIFDLTIKDDEYYLPYVELCESFLEILIKEITYHNYIIMLDSDDYIHLIINCMEKAIYLKDKNAYEIQPE